MTITMNLRDEIAEWEPELIATRRDFHMHPEMGLEEVRTSGIVAERLRALGLDEVQTGIGVTGVKGILRGGKPGKTLLLRGDMDALPIEEENEVEYKSLNPGVMHACGHDAHTAIMLGAARALVRRRAEIPGTIVFCFQPAEEGRGGAMRMLADGVLENPTVDAAIGIHMAQQSPLGTITAVDGPTLAGGDRYHVTIQGKGGHGAMPHTTVDALLIAATIVVNLQSLVAREVDPQKSLVVTQGTLHAGTAPNVIADTATFSGTTRWYDPEVGEYIAQRFPQLVREMAGAMRATADVQYTRNVPATVNDPGMAQLVREAAAEVVGADNVLSGPPVGASEDFSYFTQRVPSCFFFVGSRDDASGKIWGHHHPRFDIDERSLVIGVEAMVRSALRYLEL